MNRTGAEWRRNRRFESELQKAEVIEKSMRSNRERGDDSLFPTSIVILVQDSINETKPQAALEI